MRAQTRADTSAILDESILLPSGKADFLLLLTLSNSHYSIPLFTFSLIVFRHPDPHDFSIFCPLLRSALFLPRSASYFAHSQVARGLERELAIYRVSGYRCARCHTPERGTETEIRARRFFVCFAWASATRTSLRITNNSLFRACSIKYQSVPAPRDATLPRF